MQIIEVTNKQQAKHFRDVVSRIYKNDTNYVRPLNTSIEEVFDPQSNSYFSHGKVVRYILQNNHGIIGRIAAFVNEKKAYGFDQPTGGIGFFECVDDEQAAFMLFDAGKKWLLNQGMEAMDGPINFGENDNFWGLLVEGFSQPGFGMQYNPAYYQKFFEKYGFEHYYDQITNHLDLNKPFPHRFWKIAEWVGQKPDYHFKHFNWKESNKFLNDFTEVYNDAWRFHENFQPMDRQVLTETIAKTKAFLMKELIWYAYYKNEPIGFIVLFPDINQIIKHFNGKLNLMNKLRFWWMVKRKKMSRVRVVILGVKPKHQRSGIESGLFWHLKGAVEKNPQIKEMELSWVGDFNPKMRALQESMGADFGKKHITYRYLFDESKRGKDHHYTIATDTKYKNQ